MKRIALGLGWIGLAVGTAAVLAAWFLVGGWLLILSSAVLSRWA